MNTSFKLKSRLCQQFVKGPYARHNLDRINYVMKIYRKQTKKINTNEEKVINRLKEHNIWCETQQPIPILSSEGKLEHLPPLLHKISTPQGVCSPIFKKL